MGFASSWLRHGSLFPRLVEEAPHENTGIIVAVPAFDEPGIISLLESLQACREPQCKTEVIIIINAPAGASGKSLENNLQSVRNIEKWKRERKSFFNLFAPDLGQPDIRRWGVGLARKAGIDEALRRFDSLDRPDGIIVNLDGDCRVSRDYFHALENDFLLRKERKACSIYFEHPLEGNDYPPEVYESAKQYEIHLRYYLQALKYTGFPNVVHTVGSSMAVRALPCMKAGGMNRKQAGEDFYFIQKLLPLGGFFTLNTATVYPSPRVSDRVPFGTGAAVKRMIDTGEKEYLSYNPKAFEDLRSFFVLCMTADHEQRIDNRQIYRLLPFSVRSFISEDEWSEKISGIINNTSGRESFRKRFFEWFNMFRIVKFLNHVSTGIYRKTAAPEAAREMLDRSGYDLSAADDTGLLNFLRKLEKES